MKSLLAGVVIVAAAGLAGAQTHTKISASAIMIEPVEVADVSIPEEFRYAIYERLVQHVQASGLFQHVYRSGDREGKKVPDLVVLHTTVEAFKEGSQMQRELVPVVAGTTTVDVTAKLVGKDGKELLDQKVAGKVRIFGENLGATNDLAKRITKLLKENF